jgi:hypothetical protein
LQTAAELAAVAFDQLPTGQALQVEMLGEPACVLYVPAAHGKHALADVSPVTF